MKKDIILSGVGGQGILTIAALIGLAAIDMGLKLKQSEVHGMSQRGGDVQSHLRISDKEIYSDLIPYGKADMIISVEPLEALRYLPYLSADGWIISNSKPFINIAKYPDINLIIEEIKRQPRYILFDAEAVARDCGSVKLSNVVILGAASAYLSIPDKNFEKAIYTLFQKKGSEVIENNIKAFYAGKKQSYQPIEV
ncbi:MAG: indolepyruvate oxidoreductase subunit beta [Ignavibacteria bacterium]